MRKGLWVASIALLATVVAIVFTRSQRYAEPVYQGQTFGQWLRRVPSLPDADDPAVVAIRNMGPQAAPLLAAALAEQPTLRERLYRSLPLWIWNLVPSTGRKWKPAWEIQDAAAAVLMRLGPEAESAIPGAIECLDNPEKRIRENSVKVLGVIGVGKEEVVPPLMKLLSDSESAYHAMLALARLSVSIKNIVPALTEAARAGDAKSRYWALVTLEQIGYEAKPALPVLIHALQTGDWETRVTAARTLGLIGPEAMAALPALTNNLSYEQQWVRKCAAIALGRIGPGATSAIPALTIALTNDAYNSVDIARTLWVIDHSQVALVIPVIEKELTATRDAGQTTYSFLNAIDLAGEIGAPSSNMVKFLELLVTDEDALVRFNAAYALWRIVPKFEPRMRPILEELKGFETHSQPAPPGHGNVFAGLMDLRDKRESYPVRLAALGALWQFVPAQRSALKAQLVELLEDWDELVGMKDVIPEEKVLIPALEDLLQDSSCRSAHAAARDALRKLQGTDGERW